MDPFHLKSVLWKLFWQTELTPGQPKYKERLISSHYVTSSQPLEADQVFDQTVALLLDLNAGQGVSTGSKGRAAQRASLPMGKF